MKENRVKLKDELGKGRIGNEEPGKDNSLERGAPILKNWEGELQKPENRKT